MTQLLSAICRLFCWWAEMFLGLPVAAAFWWVFVMTGCIR
jgi:hypothetical protein